MTYILLFAFYVGGGWSPASAEFSDKTACEQAVATLRSTASASVFRFAICVPKSSDARP